MRPPARAGARARAPETRGRRLSESLSQPRAALSSIASSSIARHAPRSCRPWRGAQRTGRGGDRLRAAVSATVARSGGSTGGTRSGARRRGPRRSPPAAAGYGPDSSRAAGAPAGPGPPSAASGSTMSTTAKAVPRAHAVAADRHGLAPGRRTALSRPNRAGRSRRATAPRPLPLRARRDVGVAGPGACISLPGDPMAAGWTKRSARTVGPDRRGGGPGGVHGSSPPGASRARGSRRLSRPAGALAATRGDRVALHGGPSAAWP